MKDGNFQESESRCTLVGMIAGSGVKEKKPICSLTSSAIISLCHFLGLQPQRLVAVIAHMLRVVFVFHSFHFPFILVAHSLLFFFSFS